jgi:hypothetical protein
MFSSLHKRPITGTRVFQCSIIFRCVDEITRYKIQDILFSNHGPHKGIKSTNIQRKNHNYIEYSYTMTYLSQHFKSNKQVINNNHVVFVARLLSLIQIIFDKFVHCIKY